MPEPTQKRSISLVIPMYNEEANIEHAIHCAIDAFAQHGLDWEIIVVDDASSDRSASLVDAIAAREPRVRLLRHEENRKLGRTIRTGFAAVRNDLVLYMDADLPFDPFEVGRAIRAMDATRSDMIAGYRFDRTTEGFKRTVYSYFYNALIGFLFGWPHRDINFSFKLATREVIEAIDLKSEGSLIDAELIVKARNLGFVIQQLGLDYFPRTKGLSMLSSPTVILKILAELWKLAPDMRRPVRRTPSPRQR